MYPPKLDMLQHLVGSRGRSRLLRALFARRGRRPWLRELGREVHIGWSGLYHELEMLCRIGLISRKREGGACFFVVDESHPLAEPLYRLVEAAEAFDFPLERL